MGQRANFSGNRDTTAGGSRLYCFDALSATPETLWTYLTGGGIFSSPAVSNGMVYVGSGDRYVDAFGIPEVSINEKISSPENQSISIEVYPNPFQEKTVIKYAVSSKHQEKSEIIVPTVHIYDATGRLVKTRHLFQGNHLTSQPVNQNAWDGKDDSSRGLPEGIYFLHIKKYDKMKGAKWQNYQRLARYLPRCLMN